MNSKYSDTTLVLLVNLGTPSKPETKEVRKYLAEFLSDKDVIRMPRIFWLPILHLIILRFRPKKSAELYKKVWTKWGSPLLYNTYLQAGLLRKRYADKSDGNILIDVAMRYGEPSLENKITEYYQNGLSNILILPMFPQYSTTTAKSIASKIHEISRKHNNFDNNLTINIIKDFHANEKYISALADRIINHRKKFSSSKKLLLSFHGIPQSYIASDEPYQDQCFKTAKLIVEKLQLKPESYDIVFQSRFGKAEWIKPYLAETLEKLGKSNEDDIQVFCPGFVSDCLETIEEINEESRELFLESGGKKFDYIPCLNGDSKFIDALESIIDNRDHLAISYKRILEKIT